MSEVILLTVSSGDGPFRGAAYLTVQHVCGTLKLASDSPVSDSEEINVTRSATVCTLIIVFL